MKTIKRIIKLALLVAFVTVCWKVYRHFEEKEPVQMDRQEQKQLQQRQAVTIRLMELEETGGKGRIRLNKDVENAARLLYNIRHKEANLPLL